MVRQQPRPTWVATRTSSASATPARRPATCARRTTEMSAGTGSPSSPAWTTRQGRPALARPNSSPWARVTPPRRCATRMSPLRRRPWPSRCSEIPRPPGVGSGVAAALLATELRAVPAQPAADVGSHDRQQGVRLLGLPEDAWPAWQLGL